LRRRNSIQIKKTKVEHTIHQKISKKVLHTTHTEKISETELEYLIENSKRLPFVGTFLSFCFNLLNDHKKNGYLIIDEDDRKNIILDVVKHILVKNTRLEETVNGHPKTKQMLIKLIDISRPFAFNTTDFFAKIALQSDTDTYEPEAEKVSLITMHTTKGLGFLW